MEAVLTAAVGGLTAIVGVVVGGLVTRRGQDHQWARDQQVAAYRDVLGHYARFAMTINRAHRDRRGWDYDWGAWSAALVTASLVAPAGVAHRLEEFGAGVQQFLDAAASRDPRHDPLPADELAAAMAAAERAQVRLVNEIRVSLGQRAPLGVPFGGTFTGPRGRRPADP